MTLPDQQGEGEQVAIPILRISNVAAAGMDRIAALAADLVGIQTGARLVAHAPISIVVDGIGLNCTGFSYNGTLCICAISCREMLPDPEVFAACLREAFTDLAKAADDHDQRRIADREAMQCEPTSNIRRVAAPRSPRRRKGNGRRSARASATGSRVTH